MLTNSMVTWNEEGFKTENPTAVIFESIYAPVQPIFIENEGDKRPILSLKYYNIQFAAKSFPVCLAQYINPHGQIDQVIINGTGHHHLHLSGLEYSGLSYK